MDVFDSTLQYKIISKEDGQIMFEGMHKLDCDTVPQICDLAEGGGYPQEKNKWMQSL